MIKEEKRLSEFYETRFPTCPPVFSIDIGGYVQTNFKLILFSQNKKLHSHTQNKSNFDFKIVYCYSRLWLISSLSRISIFLSRFKFMLMLGFIKLDIYLYIYIYIHQHGYIMMKYILIYPVSTPQWTSHILNC